MEISREEVTHGVALVRCTGRLNMVVAKSLKAFVDETVSTGHRQVVVDLGGVPFIDSSGLGALIGALKTSRQAGGDLRIAGAGEQVLGVLRLTNLERVLRPYPSVEDAISGW